LPRLTWEGARHVENAVLIGTPNAGSIEAMGQLCEGLDLTAFIAQYPAALLGTMPAIYELLPRTRHGALVDADGKALDIMDEEVWVSHEWGLANPAEAKTLEVLIPEAGDAEERREIALEHMRKCLDNARRFHAALDVRAEAPAGLRLVLYAGDSQDTAVAAEALQRAVKIVEKGPGDGTVPRYSAVMDDREGRADAGGSRLETPIDWDDVNFLFEDHLGLTKSDTFADSILFLLLEQ
jgi:hypothetical protein